MVDDEDERRRDGGREEVAAYARREQVCTPKRDTVCRVRYIYR